MKDSKSSRRSSGEAGPLFIGVAVIAGVVILFGVAAVVARDEVCAGFFDFTLVNFLQIMTPLAAAVFIAAVINHSTGIDIKRRELVVKALEDILRLAEGATDSFRNYQQQPNADRAQSIKRGFQGVSMMLGQLRDVRYAAHLRLMRNCSAVSFD